MSIIKSVNVTLNKIIIITVSPAGNKQRKEGGEAVVL